MFCPVFIVVTSKEYVVLGYSGNTMELETCGSIWSKFWLAAYSNCDFFFVESNERFNFLYVETVLEFAMLLKVHGMTSLY